VNKSDSKPILSWFACLLLHCFVAVGISGLIGFLPEVFLSKLYYNSGIEAYSPAIATAALLLGYFVAPRLGAKAATATWACGAAWMICGIYDTGSRWSHEWSSDPTRWSYVVSNLFGPTIRCSGSECLGELLFTTPFTASVAYSLGAFLSRMKGNFKSIIVNRPSYWP
jgi:hypothetical protein